MNREQSVRRPGLGRCLVVGLLAGLAASAVVLAVSWLLQAVVGQTYLDELGTVHLGQATVLSTLIGAVGFYAVARWSRRPVPIFAILAMSLAVAYSVMVAVQPPATGAVVVVIPLHLLVAGVTVGAFALAGHRVYTTTPAGLRGYPLFVTSLLAVFLIAFLAVEALEVPLLTDPTPWLREAGLAAAAIGVGLLVADVFLPVPSSAVMVTQGALFGVGGGTVLSLAGGLGATLVGFLVGRRSRPLVARIVPPEQRTRAEYRLARYGPLAIIVTRPVPMLAETTAIVAGTSQMRWQWAALAGAVGNLIPALLYALTGALTTALTNQTLAFGAVVAVAATFWLVIRRVTASMTAYPAGSSISSHEIQGPQRHHPGRCR